MDRMPSERTREDARLDRIAAAFRDGIVLVDDKGAVVWMDRNARRRVNGELRALPLPLPRSDTGSVDCFISPVELAVNGERLCLGVIQETEVQKQSPDLMAAIESVLADSTAWFARIIIEKLRTVNPSTTAEAARNGTAQLDTLSAREREVLGLICEGRSDVQMAMMLGLSENTVRNHIAALYRKIGVNRRTAAVIWARERGISCREDLGWAKRERRSGDGHGGGAAGGTLSY